MVRTPTTTWGTLFVVVGSPDADGVVRRRLIDLHRAAGLREIDARSQWHTDRSLLDAPVLHSPGGLIEDDIIIGDDDTVVLRGRTAGPRGSLVSVKSRR
jgi:hypothetical protein